MRVAWQAPVGAGARLACAVDVGIGQTPALPS